MVYLLDFEYENTKRRESASCLKVTKSTYHPVISCLIIPFKSLKMTGGAQESGAHGQEISRYYTFQVLYNLNQ